MGKNKAKGAQSGTFEKILSAKRDELRKRIEQTRTEMSGERDPDDEAAAAVWSIERELAMANLDRDTRTLSEVQAALDSIEAGSYGTCLRCQEKISDARLHALPWTRLCLECAGGGINRGNGAGSSVHPGVVSSAGLLSSLRGRARAK